MKTAESNRLIAEFMGAKKREKYFDTRPVEYLINNYWTAPGNLKYHTSWDWQIPAWSKAIQEYDLPRKSVYKTRYAVATAMNDIGLGFQILVELITEINQNKQP